MALRVLYPDPPYPHSIYTVPQPYIEYSGQPNLHSSEIRMPQMGYSGPATLELNALGLRGDLPLRKSAGEYRILVFGGSTTFNGEPLENTIPLRLQYYLQTRGLAGVRVYNWGVPWFNTTQQLILFLNQGVDFDPDMVIFYGGINELNPLGFDPRPGYPGLYIRFEKAIHDAETLADPNAPLPWKRLLGSIAYRSKIVREIAGYRLSTESLDMSRLRDEVGYNTLDWKNRIVEIYIASLKKAAMIATASGIRFAAFHQPCIFHKVPMNPREARTLSPEFQSMMQIEYPLMGRRMEKLSGPRIFCKDITDVFRGDSRPYFWDYVHVTNEGNDVIARRMAESLFGIIETDMATPRRKPLSDSGIMATSSSAR